MNEKKETKNNTGALFNDDKVSIVRKGTIKINDETTNKEVFSQTTTSFTANDYYYQYSNTFTLVEDTFYTLEIKQGSNLIYRDKIFCTNQTISSYSVNNNEYTVHSTENEFIVL